MIKSGDLFLFYWDGEAVSAQMDGNFSGDMASRETSTKQSGKATESEPTRYSGTASFTCLFDENATLGPDTLFDDWKAGAKKDAKISTEVTGDKAIAGTAYISSFSNAYPDQDNVECSIDLTFTGEITNDAIVAP